MDAEHKGPRQVIRNEGASPAGRLDVPNADFLMRRLCFGA